MKIRGEWLKARRNELKKSTRVLAEEVGVSSAAISNLETKDVMPSLEFAYKLAKALKKSTDWVLTGIDDEAASRQIPIIGSTQAGPDTEWLEYGNDWTFEYIDFPVLFGNYYALKVIGDSMSPRILEGEAVIVDPYGKPQTGEEVVLKFKNGETMVKTLSAIKENTIVLDSTNQTYQRMIRNVSEIVSMHPVIGVARAMMIKHR